MELKSAFDWTTGGELLGQKKAAEAALDFLLDLGQQLPELIVERERRREKLKDVLKQTEIYWNDVAPAGEGFRTENGIELLLYDVSRFAAGLVRIVQKADEQKALMDHRTATGQEVTESDRQRWFAYLDVAHLAQEVLSPNPPSENSDTEQH